jgi:hypothetical protein
VLTVYITHRRLWEALTAIRAGGAAVICGVEVRRTPDIADRYTPAGGRYRVGQGPEMLLIASIDAVAREAQLRPVPGGVPWRDDDEPAPSYHGRGPATGCDAEKS